MGKRDNQRMTEQELRGVPGFMDSWDYRAQRAECPELMGNLNKVFIDRDLAESCEFHDIRNAQGRIIKLIRRRDDEVIPHPIQDLEDPDEEEIICEFGDMEDAMQAVEVEHGPSLPKDKWDVVFNTAMRKLPDGTWIRIEIDTIPVFPKLRDKRLKGYSHVLEKLVRKGKLNGRTLYSAIQTAFKDNEKLIKTGRAPRISGAQAARLWEIYKIEKYMKERK